MINDRWQEDKTKIDLKFNYKIQDTRFFISGKLPIVHDYTIFNKMLVTYFLD